MKPRVFQEFLLEQLYSFCGFWQCTDPYCIFSSFTDWRMISPLLSLIIQRKESSFQHFCIPILLTVNYSGSINHAKLLLFIVLFPLHFYDLTFSILDNCGPLISLSLSCNTSVRCRMRVSDSLLCCIEVIKLQMLSAAMTWTWLRKLTFYLDQVSSVHNLAILSTFIFHRYYQTATPSIKLKLDFGPFVQVVNEMDAEPCHQRSGTLLRSIAFEPVFLLRSYPSYGPVSDRVWFG